MPPSGDPYLDVPLNLGKKNIRLVTLEPGDASESIKCNLQSHALDDECPAYVALSYTWGAKGRYDDIHLNGSSFPVGRNLWHFLDQMRMQCQDVIFWIDAISIDQANVLEQNHQVQMMREIYTQACSVWVWLGEADDATMSDIAMQCLDMGVAHNGEADATLQNVWNSWKAKAVLALCHREYWTRIWIVQEVGLAEEAKILCGSQCVDWHKLQMLLTRISYISGGCGFPPAVECGKRVAYNKSYVGGIVAIQHSPAAVILRARGEHLDRPQPLVLLLSRYHKQHSTDVRDKVYALHGLASDSNGIAINYQIDPKELLVQIIHHACSQSASKTTMRKPPRTRLPFAEMMRDSLKVSCDEEELIDIISMAQSGSRMLSIH